MRAFAGNASATALDSGTAQYYTNSHTGDGQQNHYEARNVQHAPFVLLELPEVVLKILLEKHIVDEAGIARPVVLR